MYVYFLFINLIGLEFSNSDTNTMVVTHFYFVYENQRWNPVTGYTSHRMT